MDNAELDTSIDQWAGPTTQLFAVIGLLWLSVKILSFWRVWASIFILPGKSLSRYGKRGTWAVVTGASDGLGKEFALQLARKGFSILLVSRTQSKLDDLAKVIEVTHNVKTRVLAMDFSENRDADYTKLKELLSDIEVAVLVNNVGQSHSIPVPFVETEQKEMNDIITINCMGTLKVTQLVIPSMIKRRNGLILTMASFGGLLPTPLLATYSGSKAFLQQWSAALASELKPKGIKVQVVQSYLVTSAMSKIRRTSLLIPNPRQFVRATLSSIGRHGGAQGISATSTPYWSHAILHWFIATFIGTMNSGLIFVNRKMHEGIRRRALRKAQRQAKGR